MYVLLIYGGGLTVEVVGPFPSDRAAHLFAAEFADLPGFTYEAHFVRSEYQGRSVPE